MKIKHLIVVIVSLSIFSCSGSNSEKKVINQGGRMPDLEKLLSSKDTTSCISKIMDYIFKLCNYGEKIENLTDEQKNFYLITVCEGEINNGGINQFYFNSSGDFSHETVTALTAIGAQKTANIIKTANDQFPNKSVPQDRVKRQEILAQIEAKANKVWDELDDKFYSYPDKLDKLIFDYVLKNKDKF